MPRRLHAEQLYVIITSDVTWTHILTNKLSELESKLVVHSSIKVVTKRCRCSVVCRHPLSMPTRCRDRIAYRSGQQTHKSATLLSEVASYRPTCTTRTVIDEADGRHGGPVDDAVTRRRQRGGESELPT